MNDPRLARPRRWRLRGQRWEKGKQADLVVRGNPAQKIEDIENVEIVFKEGTGYDPAKLIQSIQGQEG